MKRYYTFFLLLFLFLSLDGFSQTITPVSFSSGSSSTINNGIHFSSITGIHSNQFLRKKTQDYLSTGIYKLIKLSPALKNTEQEKIQISIHPNPASDYIQVSGKSNTNSHYILNIYDLTGRIVKTFPISQEKLTGISERIPVDNLQKGHYLINISDEKQTKVLFVYKFIKL